MTATVTKTAKIEAVLTGNILTLKGQEYLVECSKFSHEGEDLEVIDLTKIGGDDQTTYSVTEDHDTLTGETVRACTCLGYKHRRTCKHLIVIDLVK